MSTDLEREPFPARSWEDWRQTLEPKGSGSEGTSAEQLEEAYQRLVTTSLDGFPIQPLYGPGHDSSDPDRLIRRDLLTGLLSDGQNGWGRIAEVAHPHPKTTLLDLDEEVARGVSGVWLRFDNLSRNGVFPLDLSLEEALPQLADGGLSFLDAGNLARFLQKLSLPDCQIFLDAGNATVAGVALLLEAFAEIGFDPARLQGCLGCDPLSDIARGAKLPGIDRLFQQLKGLAYWSATSAPQLRPALVSTAVYHEAGASAGQEVGIALASGLSVLKQLSKTGRPLGEVAPQIQFSFSVTGDLFAECAKLRAARLVWARLLEECGGEEMDQRMALHARTSWRTATRYDRGVNALRGTVETFAAIIGGADTISTASFDEALGPAGRFGRKVAANSQLMLKEESFLNRVADPAGGSWYVEALTSRLAEVGWDYFQSIEARGGMVESLRHGAIHRDIEGKASERRSRLATRSLAITGTSEFPNLKEDVLQRPDGDSTLQWLENRWKKLEQALENSPPGSRQPAAGHRAGSLGAARQYLTEGTPFAVVARLLAVGGTRRSWPAGPLPRERDAELFERLRLASEAWQEKEGELPRVFLANLGSFRSHRLRSSFARRFVNVAGIEAESSSELLDEGSVGTAWAASQLPVVILCGSDEVYEELALPAANTLRKAGAQRIFLAGQPGHHENQWREAGISDYLYLGADIEKILRDLLAELGVPL